MEVHEVRGVWPQHTLRDPSAGDPERVDDFVGACSDGLLAGAGFVDSGHDVKVRVDLASGQRDEYVCGALFDVYLKKGELHRLHV